MSDAVAQQIIAAWARIAAVAGALRDAPPLDQPAGRDLAVVLLVERHRGGDCSPGLPRRRGRSFRSLVRRNPLCTRRFGVDNLGSSSRAGRQGPQRHRVLHGFDSLPQNPVAT